MARPETTLIPWITAGVTRARASAARLARTTHQAADPASTPATSSVARRMLPALTRPRPANTAAKAMIVAGFTGEGKKTVIPARATAKVSLRLVPDQDPEVILGGIEKHIQSLTTPGVEVRVEVLGSAPPVTCRVDNPAAKALRAAYSEVFGRDTALIRVGGSIPVSVDFQEAVGAPIVISGIGEADAAAHSPNERLSVDQYLRGIEAVIRFICKLGE